MRPNTDKLDIKIPTFAWKQIGGDMSADKYGGTIAEADGDHIELLMIQPVREYVGEREAKDVGHPFWTREAWYDFDDLDPSGKNAKEIKSALQSIGVKVRDGELVTDQGDIIGEVVGEPSRKATPEIRALVIAEALFDYGYGADEGPGGWSEDIYPHREVEWSSGGKKTMGEYLADEDAEFRREVLEEEDEEEEELEENARNVNADLEYRPPDRSGESVDQFGVGGQESDYFFEYGSGYSPKIYEVTRGGALKELPLSVQHLVREGHIGKAIEKRAAAIGQHAGVVFEIRRGEARQVGNVEGHRHGAKITWSRGVHVPNRSHHRNPFPVLKQDPRMRIESQYKAGEPGAVYEFNVKFYRGDYSADVDDDSMYIETGHAVEVFADVLRERFPWVGKVHITGRSGGWLAVEDKQGKATSKKIEQIADMVDDARKEFGKYLDEQYSGPATRGRRSAR